MCSLWSQPGCRAQKLLVLFCLTKCDGQPPICEKMTGGANVPVVDMGYRDGLSDLFKSAAQLHQLMAAHASLKVARVAVY
jgi:hypothetical protein